MRTLLFLSVSILFTVSFTHAQFLNGRVIDPNDQVIQDVHILDKDKKIIAQTDSLGMFKVNIGKHPIFGVEKRGYRTQWFNRKDNKGLEMTIRLEYYYQELADVEVKTNKSTDFLDLRNVNILDYRPMGEEVLTLKRQGRTYYVGIDNIGKEGKRYPFYKETPRYLFEDCMKNMHIVCDQNVYQFTLYEDSLHIVSSTSRIRFETYLKPCIAKFNDKLVLKKLSSNNQRYQLDLLEKGKPKTTFYDRTDEVSAAMAAEDGLFIGLKNNEDLINDSLNENVLPIRRMMREIHKGENPDVNIAMARAFGFGKWDQMTAGYMLHAYPVNIRSFQVGQFVCVIDYEINEVSIYNQKGKLKQSTQFYLNEDIKEVWQDKSSEKIYLFTRANGNHHVFNLDVLTGRTTFLLSLREEPFTKSEKVYDGWLYYRELENGFHEIKRIKLAAH